MLTIIQCMTGRGGIGGDGLGRWFQVQVSLLSMCISNKKVFP